jgi:hypothetical protein
VAGERESFIDTTCTMQQSANFRTASIMSAISCNSEWETKTHDTESRIETMHSLNLCELDES